MSLLILYASISLLLSFACSIMEAVLLSVTPSHVAMLEREGKKSAPRLRALKDNINRPLAAILTLNTVANTFGAMGVGAQATLVFGDAYIGVTSGALTLLILVLSEIIPKTLGAVYWRRLAHTVATVLSALVIAMRPVVWVLEAVTRLIGGGSSHGKISREEVRAMADLGEAQGVIEAGESRVLRNLLRFRSLRARDVMTPRTVVLAVPEGRTVGNLMRVLGELPFSRIPVFGTGLDDVHGYVLKDQVLYEVAMGHSDRPLSELTRRIMMFPALGSLPTLFDQMVKAREHIALLVDEYGGTAGIVTMEDIVETLLGLEIMDEVDSVADMQALARRAWEDRARALGLEDKVAHSKQDPQLMGPQPVGEPHPTGPAPKTAGHPRRGVPRLASNGL